MAFAAGCRPSRATDARPPADGASTGDEAPSPITTPLRRPVDDGDADAHADSSYDSSRDATPPLPPAPARSIGPYEVRFAPHRASFVIAPASTADAAHPHRLIASLHGVCNPPNYACGFWMFSAASRGFLVCPTGNARCKEYDAPTWDEPIPLMDADLERAIAALMARFPGEITREGAVLTGFSRGSYAAARIASMHPGRWPYLVLNEADVALTAASLRAAKVRAVALVAGEWGTQIAGERTTVDALVAAGYPARLWIMPKVGHAYSPNIDVIMGEAIDWLLAHE